jgi:D-serine deaminase-like pyridoxal phosphate-dependent protein
VLLRTPISFEGEVPQLAALAVKTPRLTVVVDHFRHGELLSRAAESAGKKIAVLIAVDTGRQLMGVHPGPDCESLSRALVQQGGLRLRGIFADAEPSASAAGRQGLTAGRALELARHCLGHLRSRGIAAEDVVLGLGADEGLTAGPEADSCTLVWCPVEVCGGVWWPATSATGGAACEVRVISRPALEFCVIAAGSRSGLMTSAARVLKPSGARVSGWDVHHTRLHLTGAAVDLRIGDTVTLGNFDKHT